jgi:uncharacterized protein
VDSNLVWVFAAAVIFIAYLVRGIAGFGSGLIAVPLLALVLPVEVVVPVVVLFDWLGSASQGLRNRHLIAWRDELPLIPFTLIGVALGLTLLDTLASPTLKQALGAFVIVYAVYQVLPLPALRGSRLFAVPCGFVGGVIGTMFGTGGPLYVIYFGLRDLDKDAFRATFSANYLIDGVIRLVAFAAFGLYSRESLPAILAGLPLLAGGLWIGGRIHSGLSAATFARLISLLLLASGMALLLNN